MTVVETPGLTWTDDVDCRRGAQSAQSDGENLNILDESPHGVSMVSLLPGAIDFTSLKVNKCWTRWLLVNWFLLQLSHLGTTVLHMDTSTHQTALLKLKLEESNGTISWSSPTNPSITFEKTKEISPGLKLKYATSCRENITYLDEGFIDLTTLKTVELGSVDMTTVPKQTLAEISSCFQTAQTQLTLTFGSSLQINKQAVFVCPASVGQVWARLLTDIKTQMIADCPKLRWLKEQYLNLYYQDEICMGPLAADAIKVFGGRSWTLEGRDASKGSARKPSNIGIGTRMKKKSYGNIHSLKDRAYHEVTMSPTSSPTLQRRSLAVPPTFPLRPLMSRWVEIFRVKLLASCNVITIQSIELLRVRVSASLQVFFCNCVVGQEILVFIGTLISTQWLLQRTNTRGGFQYQSSRVRLDNTRQ